MNKLDCAYITKKYKNNPMTYITSSRLHRLEPSNIPLLNIDNEEDKNILTQNLYKHITKSFSPFKMIFNKMCSCFQTKEQKTDDNKKEESENLIPITFV
jgi:predicted GTPase